MIKLIIVSYGIWFSRSASWKPHSNSFYLGLPDFKRRGWQGAGIRRCWAGWLPTAFFIINLVVIEEPKTKLKSTCNSPNPCNINCQCTGDDGNPLLKKTVSSPLGRQAGRKEGSISPSLDPSIPRLLIVFTHPPITNLPQALPR